MKVLSGTGILSFEEFCKMIDDVVRVGTKLQHAADAGDEDARRYLEMISKPLSEQ